MTAGVVKRFQKIPRKTATTNGGGRSIYSSVKDFDDKVNTQRVSEGKAVDKVFKKDNYSKNKKQTKEFIDKVLANPVKYAQEQVAKARAYVKLYVVHYECIELLLSRTISCDLDVVIN